MPAKLITHVSPASDASYYRRLPYDTVMDLAPIARDLERWAKVVKATGLHAD